MGTFITNYLNGLLTEEEIKKHGLTQRDLLYIKHEYIELEKMLEQYRTSIFGKKEQSEAIQAKLEIAKKLAKLLSFLGKSFSQYVSYAHYSVSGVEKYYLEESLSRDYYKTLKFISYMLTRKHQNYELGKLYYTSFYSEIERRERVVGNIDLLTQKSSKQFTSSIDALRYLDFLYGRNASFIATSHPDPSEDDRDLYYGCKELLENKDVALLGTLGGDTICYLGDDIFRDTMTRLMLFADLHGFSIADINKENQEDYAHAIEGMDISSCSIEKNNEKRFYIAKKGN